MKTSVIGFPRIGTLRELKFASEKYFRKEISEEQLKETAKELRKTHWNMQKNAGIDFISSNDFSFYDIVLDTAVLLNIIPKRYKELDLSKIDTYFAMARGYQGEHGDVKALAMKKWFNTNYHYIVPETEDDIQIKLSGNKIWEEYDEAKELGIETKPMLTGAYTMLKLCRYTGNKSEKDYVGDIIAAYKELLQTCGKKQIAWVQFDEPALVLDMDDSDKALFHQIYDELLAVEMEELQNLGFDLGLTGFDESEIADLFDINSDEAKQDDFDVDAELEKPCKSKTGDIWHLGKHTVICGDSTLPETYTALLGNTKVNLVCTDPPYLVNLESTSGKIKNDDLDDEKGYAFLKSAFERFKDAMAKDASIYVFYATSKARVFHDAYEDAGFKVGAGLVWKKDRLVLTRTDWKYIHEPIIWGWRKDGKHIWYGDQKQKTVFEFDRIKNSKKDGCGHPSSKPVPLIAYLISQCTQTNGMVLDGFLGSASTLIACEQLNRVCFGVELEPKFVDVAVERYIKLHDGNSDDVYLIRDGKRIAYSELVKEVELPDD